MSDTGFAFRLTPTGLAKRAAFGAFSGVAIGLALVRGGWWWVWSLLAIGILFSSTRSASLRDAWLVGIVSGMGVFGISSEWSRLFGVHAYVGLVVALTVFWAGAVVISSYADNLLQSMLLGPSALVLIEIVRARFPLGGYGLGMFSYAQIDGPLAPLASLVGAAGLSGIAAAVGVGLVALAQQGITVGAAKMQSRTPFVVALLQVLVLVVSVLVLSASVAGMPGAVSSVLFEQSGESSAARKHLRVVVVQVYDENRPLGYEEETSGALAKKLEGATKDVASFQPDLIVWPEGSLGSNLVVEGSVAQESVRASAVATGASILANGQPLTSSLDRFVNRNYLFSPSGSLELVSDKEKLVPFGEYVPWRPFLEPWIRSLEKIPLDGKAGKWRLFRVRDTGVGSVICFESAFSYYIRERVRAGAEVIVVETNNRSFEWSSLSAQHLAASRMRAIETQRYVVHAALSGVSAVIRPDGSMVARAGLFERKVLVADLEPSGAYTLYVRLGDWGAASLAIVSLVFGMWLRWAVGRRRSGNALQSKQRT